MDEKLVPGPVEMVPEAMPQTLKRLDRESDLNSTHAGHQERNNMGEEIREDRLGLSPNLQSPTYLQPSFFSCLLSSHHHRVSFLSPTIVVL